MLTAPIILASSSDDSWVKLIFFVIVAILWGIGQLAAKLGKKQNKPRQPFTPTFQPPQVAKAPPPLPAEQALGVTTRRVGAGGVTITTRVVKTVPPLRTVAKVPPQRPKVAAKPLARAGAKPPPYKPPRSPKVPQQPKAARQSAPRTPPPLPIPAPSRAMPAAQAVGQLAAGLASRPRTAAATATASPAQSILAASMRPDSLRTQLIVTELLRPPIALRDPTAGPAGLT